MYRIPHLFDRQPIHTTEKWGAGRWTSRLVQIRPILLFQAFFAFSLNMRAALTSIPPIINEIRQAFDISAGLAGALTSIPVFCFGFLSPAAGVLIKRIGVDPSIFVTLVGIAAGCFIRSAGDVWAAFAGTVVIGMAQTIGNIAGLMVIHRDFPKHAGTMTGICQRYEYWLHVNNCLDGAPLTCFGLANRTDAPGCSGFGCNYFLGGKNMSG